MKKYIILLIALLSGACGNGSSFFQQNPRAIYDSIYYHNLTRVISDSERDSIGQILTRYDEKRGEEIRRRKVSWKNLKFKYAKAFLYDYFGFSIVYDNKNVVPGVLAEKKLNDRQSQIAYQLASIPPKDNEEENWQAKCFEPHHALVFYNAEDEVVAYSSICFMCNQTNIFPADGYNGVSRYKNFFKNLYFPILANEEELQDYITFLQKSNSKK
jgi:hypothetical protein